MISNSIISICLATYNGQKYLKEQLDSIVNQTYKDIEVIVQDDCSTDNTVNILDTYKDKLKITIYKNNKNLGYIKNFETLLKKATGDYIAICDQDDIWELDKLEILINNIEENSLIYANSLLVDEDGNSLNKTLSDKLKNNFIDSDSCLNFLYDNCVSAHAMLFKKELLDFVFPFPSHIYFDAWIAATAASLNGVKYIDENFVKYRQHQNNTLGNVQKEIVPTRKKILAKVEKKEKENYELLNKIAELKKLKTIKKEELVTLETLEWYYNKFEHRWFDNSMYNFLKENSNIFFKITSKNQNTLALKKSIGKKLYKVAPFL